MQEKHKNIRMLVDTCIKEIIRNDIRSDKNLTSEYIRSYLNSNVDIDYLSKTTAYIIYQTIFDKSLSLVSYDWHHPESTFPTNLNNYELPSRAYNECDDNSLFVYSMYTDIIVTKHNCKAVIKHNIYSPLYKNSNREKGRVLSTLIIITSRILEWFEGTLSNLKINIRPDKSFYIIEITIDALVSLY